MPLVAKELVYQYPGAGAPALSGLSLDLTAGHVLAVCGAARTGRSTLLALLAGLLSVQSGSITVDGLRADAHNARGRVGLLLQNADEGLFGLTVREDVMFAPLQLGKSIEEASSQAENALRAVELDPALFSQRSPFSLSGGQRRRAAMAGVIAMNPSYLLLDDPLAGLDPQGRGEILYVVRELATQSFGQHTGILLTLTDLDIALRVADRLLIICGGSAAWRGTVAEFMENPPDVDPWGLCQPELVILAQRLRAQGWCLPIQQYGAPALGEAIAARVRGKRR